MSRFGFSAVGSATQDYAAKPSAKAAQVTPPRRYEEWCVVLEALKSPEQDAKVFAAVTDGEYPKSAGVTERTTQRLLDAFNMRLKRLQTALQNEMNRAVTNVDVERSLANLVTGLKPLARLALCPTLPEPIRKYLREALNGYTTRVRDALIDSARRSRAIDGILLASIKRVALEVPWSQAGALSAPCRSVADVERVKRRVLI